MTISKIILLFIFLPIASFSQVSGNQVYGNNSGYNNYAAQSNNQNKRSVITTDSTILLSINLLLNKKADCYMVTVGANQEASTVLDCNKKINARIVSFNDGLSVFGVKKEDIYIDFISQTKIYDYEVNSEQAQQIETGYEIKKNIIIKLQDVDDIDQLIELASEQEIFDLIKVEYIDENVNKTYNQLYKEAITMIKSRLKLYQEIAPLDLEKGARIVYDNFYAISPKTQYKSYQAFESSSLNIHSNKYSQRYIQKESRKQRTFYYDGTPTSGFDKIINSSEPKVGLQYVFSLSMIYTFK